MQSGKRRKLTLATGCGVHALQDGLGATLYVLLPVLAQAFGLSYAQIGLIRGAKNCAMMAFELPSGMLAERVGERLLLVFGLVCAGAATIGQEAVVPDAMETLWQDVDEEAADELVRRQRHGLVAAGPVDPVVLDPECDAVGVGPDQAAVGDGDAVGVAGQISKYRLGAGEGLLGVDDPVGSAQRLEKGVEGGSVSEAGLVTEEGEPAIPMEPEEPVEEQAPEQP